MQCCDRMSMPSGKWCGILDWSYAIMPWESSGRGTNHPCEVTLDFMLGRAKTLVLLSMGGGGEICTRLQKDVVEINGGTRNILLGHWRGKMCVCRFKTPKICQKWLFFPSNWGESGRGAKPPREGPPRPPLLDTTTGWNTCISCRDMVWCHFNSESEMKFSQPKSYLYLALGNNSDFLEE